jgi:hypothetical protein
LLDQDQILGIEPKFCCLTDKSLSNARVEFFGPGQNPQIFFVWAANQGIAVVLLVKFDYVVAAVEGPEKSDFEACDIWLTNEVGASFGLLPLACLVVESLRVVFPAVYGVDKTIT